MPIVPGLLLLQLTFEDNFNPAAPAPDAAAKWQTVFPYGGVAARTLAGNHEAECYSDSSVGENPFLQTHGLLSLTAKPVNPQSNPCDLPYDSGLITTFTSFSQLYGYFELRAKLPAGQGLWPAFWMLPASNDYTAELDIFEVLGSNPSVLYATTHGTTNGVWGSDSQAINVPDTSAAFHTYGVDWEPVTTVFYMDRQPIAVAPTPTSMNSPMYMLINLAVGGVGSWPGPPDANTKFPAHYWLDYVRAYATAGTQFVYSGGRK